MKKILNTATEILRNGSSLGIFTYYVGSDLLEFFFIFIPETKDGISFVENELGYRKVGYEDVDFFINNNGDLVVESDDVERFEIGNDGNLYLDES
mgnify:CR=1 FL=1